MLRLLHNWYHRHFSEPGTVEFMAVLLCCFVIVYYLMWLVGPIVIALCIAYLLDFFVVACERTCGIRRRLGSALVMLLFIGLSVLLLVLVVPQVIRQGAGFYNTIVALSSNVTETLQAGEGAEAAAAAASRPAAAAAPSGAAGISGVDALIAEHLYSIIIRLPEPLPSMIGIEDLQAFVARGRMAAMVFIADIMRNNFMPSVVNTIAFLVYLVVVPIFAFLMLYDKVRLLGVLRTYILPVNQTIMERLWPSLNAQIQGYIRGKLLHIVIIAAVNTAVFKFYALDYAVLLGVGMGFSVMIPYVGAVVIAIPVLTVALMQFGLSQDLLWLLVGYGVVQLLDAYVLTPMLFSRATDLDAFAILTSILIFGGLWGFWGVFFAIPLATFVKTIITQWPSAAPRREPVPRAAGHEPAPQDTAVQAAAAPHAAQALHRVRAAAPARRRRRQPRRGERREAEPGAAAAAQSAQAHPQDAGSGGPAG